MSKVRGEDRDSSWAVTLLFAILGTAALRYGFELLTIPQATRSILYLLHEVSWYLIVGLTALAVLCVASGEQVSRVARIVAAGLPLGILPPVIDVWVYGSGGFVYRYLYRADLLFRMTEDGGYVGELSAIWLAIVGAAFWAFRMRRTVAAGIAAASGMYLMFQLLGGYGPTWLRNQFLAVRPLAVDRISLQLWYIVSWCTVAAIGVSLVSWWQSRRRPDVVRVAIAMLAALQAVAATSDQPYVRLLALTAVLLPVPLLSAMQGPGAGRMLVLFSAVVAVAALVLHVPFVGLWTLLAVASANLPSRPPDFVIASAVATVPLALIGQAARTPDLTTLLLALWLAAVARVTTIPDGNGWRIWLPFGVAGVASLVLFLSSPLAGALCCVAVLVVVAWRLSGQDPVSGRTALALVLLVDAGVRLGGG